MRNYGRLPDLYGASTPIASLYLGLQPPPIDTGRALELRWRALRARLAADDAAETLLALLDDRVRMVNPSGRTLVAFARDGAVVFDDELEEFDGPEGATAGNLARGAPLLRWQQQWVPCVSAVVDRVGADLAVFSGSHEVSHLTVTGPDDEIERNAPGGWAQARYQHRAEDSWEHNAAAVADRVAALASGAGAQLVLLAGDVRAVQLVTDRLPQPVRSIQRSLTDGLEQHGTGRVHVKRSVLHELLHESAAAARRDAARDFEEALGWDNAVAGLPETVRALRQGAVDELVVTYRPDDRRLARVNADPMDVVTHASPLRTADRGHLLDVLIRAAFAQAADVTVLEPGEADLPDDVGAIVRYR